jgi:hypothetical protein
MNNGEVMHQPYWQGSKQKNVFDVFLITSSKTFLSDEGCVVRSSSIIKLMAHPAKNYYFVNQAG